MRTHLLSLCTLLAGCIPMSSASSPKPQQAMALEPGMFELDTVQGKDGTWHLSIAAGAHTPGDPPPARVAVTKAGGADRWRDLYVFKRFHDGITTLGGATVGNEDGRLHAREIDVLPALTGPGSYTLKIELGGQITTVAFEVVEVRTTSGELGLALDRRDVTSAAIRFDRDAHGIDVGYPHEPRLWVTLRTPMTRDKTRADILWYHGTEFVGRSEQEHQISGIGTATPFERTTRFWSWPKDVHLDEMPAGAWTAYVYQDGVYLTACTFEVADGNIVGRARSSAVLACARRDTTLDVKKRGGLLPVIAEDPGRKAELLALYKSDETRSLLKELIAARRSRNDAAFSRGVAVSDEENAWTDRQAANAAARYDQANAAVKDTSKEIAKLTKRYNDLVAKHGRE